MVRRKLPIGIQTFRKPREDGCCDNVYLFEFKVVELAGEGAAMAQLRSRGYVDKYRHLGQPIPSLRSSSAGTLAMSPPSRW